MKAATNFLWKKNKRKAKKNNSTSGKEKGLIPTQLFKWMAKKSRSYKHSRYSEWEAWAKAKQAAK